MLQSININGGKIGGGMKALLKKYGGTTMEDVQSAVQELINAYIANRTELSDITKERQELQSTLDKLTSIEEAKIKIAAELETAKIEYSNLLHMQQTENTRERQQYEANTSAKIIELQEQLDKKDKELTKLAKNNKIRTLKINQSVEGSRTNAPSQIYNKLPIYSSTPTETELIDLSESNNALQVAKADLELQILNKDNEIATLQNEIATLQKEIATLTNQLNILNAEKSADDKIKADILKSIATALAVPTPVPTNTGSNGKKK